MRSVDNRILIVMRREEANACIHNQLYHAATLTACSGIEMLLVTLYGELLEKLQEVEPALAIEIENYRSERTGDQLIHWGMGNWISFYREFNIFDELRNHFNYDLYEFKMPSLRRVNSEWINCKHRPYQISRETALSINNYLNVFLEETQHPMSPQSQHTSTIGYFSEIWRREWQDAIRKWIVQNRAAPQANIIEPLPKLLGLVVSLIADAHVMHNYKSDLMVAANYVISSVDLMPEDNLNVVGLVDDSAVIIFTLDWILSGSYIDEDILRRHWEDDSDVISEIKRWKTFILDNSQELFAKPISTLGDRLIWETLRRISSEGPEALWKNYWKEAY